MPHDPIRFIDFDPRQPMGSGVGLRARFPFQHWREVHYDPTKANWLVHKLLPPEGVAVLYGKCRSFKSFVALDLGVAIARGEPWAGRKTKKGIVVYIAGEGGPGLVKRIEAYKLKHGFADIDLYLGRVSPNLGTRPGDVAELVAAIRELLSDEAPVLIIIDTLARTLADKDENTEGMRNFVNNAEDISAQLGCLVLAIHHEGARDTGRMRGGTTADAGSVATWRISRPDKSGLSSTIEVQDAKDSESGFSMIARLVKFEFGDEHEDGRESTLIVDTIEEVAAAADDEAKRPPSIPKSQAAFMTAVDQALERKGTRKRPFKDGPYVNAVTREQVLERYLRVRADAAPATRERDFRRQLGDAVKREDLVTRERDGETLVWKPKK